MWLKGEDVPDLVLKAEDPPAVTEVQGRGSQGKGALDYAGDDGHTRASTGFGNVGATWRWQELLVGMVGAKDKS